ncbi:Alpha-(1,4)-fucosyltransferase [Platanthera zijinensis]|uniref:Fucosyltransferase n=1 Tax=Platanthera zijinensis TaxID=2320716 RepID=A0AAP0GDK2_9ASPA
MVLQTKSEQSSYSFPKNLAYVMWTFKDCTWCLFFCSSPCQESLQEVNPNIMRWKGEPLRVYIDLEASRKRSGFEDIFIGYHANDDVQSTYAGSFFHNNRNYHVSPDKLNDTIVYWSSSRCVSQRNQLAARFLSLVPHHSFGKCLNNVGGLDKALSFYPECSADASADASASASAPQWWDHLHCAMSHYKFVLAIENTVTESYVTEKLYYALDAGAVPIYFGAPNVWDFIPPGSIVDGSKFSSPEELASYVKSVADDPVAYAEFHAWRRCGVLGNYGKTRAASLDTLPCRLCELVRRKGGRDGRTL